MRRRWVALAALALASCKSDPPVDDGVDPNLNSDGDCLIDTKEAELGTDPKSVDSDGDTLGDCDEIELGTDPIAADSDSDGFADPDEIACVSDPIDATEKCYACGWKHNDPGDLMSTGSAEGQVIANIQLVDQCLEPVALWDFATTASSPAPTPPRYHILFMTAAW